MAKGRKQVLNANRNASHPSQRKPSPPETPPTIKILPIHFKFGDRFSTIFGERMVVGRPYTSAGGKIVAARVQPAGQPGSVAVWVWRADERVRVKRGVW